MRIFKALTLKRLMMTTAAVALLAAAVQGQSFRLAGTEFNAMRPVQVPSGKTAVVVTEFFHHGEIRPDGRNVIVAGRRGELVPMRVLQLGPGDFCRLAFQPVRAEEHDIFYGGDPPSEAIPSWTARDGLLLETRRFRHCDLNSLESVRRAFEAAQPIGGDYVDNVYHASNPFLLGAEPFLSRYSGYIKIPSAATYGFITSSQDCSFLLIDDKLVVSAPGRHRPARRAFRGTRGDVKLSAGPHKFEYYHAAAGDEATMVAAWEINPRDPKPDKPVPIPSDVFGTRAVAHVAAGHVSMRTTKLVPDFLVKIVGDAPLPDNGTPLVAVSFKDVSPKSVGLGGKLLWEFGDGQISEKQNPDHIYLHPGLYAVKLSFKLGSSKVETTNRIQVDRPTLGFRDKQYTLDDFLPILRGYDPRTLDAAGLLQLVSAYEAKALELQAKAEQQSEREKQQEKRDEPELNKKSVDRMEAARVKQLLEQQAEADRYFAAAAEVGKAAFVAESAARGDEDLLKLAERIGPMVRDRLGNAELAFQLWKGAAARIVVGQLKAECEVEAADIAVNDLVNPAAAKELLDAATKRLATRKGTAAGKLQRTWGDYYALTGDGKSARKAYGEAAQNLGTGRRQIERTAWQGAHSRSTEDYIVRHQLDRAAAEIRAWQNDFPSGKIDGYLTLLYAKYWAARQKYAQAIAQSEQLLAANPDSPYADQSLWLAAECELKRGKKDRAVATLHSLVKDYPGSPLLPQAKKTLAGLEGK